MKYYRIFKFEASRGYNHIRLEVHDPKWQDGVYAFQWQETQGEPGELYAGRFHIESSDFKSVMSFTRKFDIHFYRDFQGVIQMLEKKGYVLAEYCDPYHDDSNGYRHTDLVCADWIDDEGWSAHRRFYAETPEGRIVDLTGGCDPNLGKRTREAYGTHYHLQSGPAVIKVAATAVRTTRFQESVKLVNYYLSKNIE